MIFPREIWKPVVDYEGLYEVSSVGRVRSLNYNKTGQVKILKAHNDKDGYLRIELHKHGIAKSYYVHRLVAQAFIPNPENKPCVDHINTMKSDNFYKNLRWVTHKENNNNELTRQHLTGKHHSLETKRKISEAQKKYCGEKHPMYGKHHSEETKQKISIANKGRKHTEESKQKLSEALKGRVISEEQKKKISETLKNKYRSEKSPMYGRKHTEESKRKMSASLKGENNPRSKPVEILKNGVSLGIFSCASEIERKAEELFGTKLHHANISAVCLGKLPYYKGYTFKFIEKIKD